MFKIQQRKEQTKLLQMCTVGQSLSPAFQRYPKALDPHPSPSSAGRASPRLSHGIFGHRAVGQASWPSIALALPWDIRAQSRGSGELAEHRPGSPMGYSGTEPWVRRAGRASPRLSHGIFGHRAVGQASWPSIARLSHGIFGHRAVGQASWPSIAPALPWDIWAQSRGSGELAKHRPALPCNLRAQSHGSGELAEHRLALPWDLRAQSRGSGELDQPS